MNSMTTAALTALTFAGIAGAQTLELEGPYAPSRWSDTGIAEGTTQVRETVELFYDVTDSNPADGVSFRTAEYSAIANASGQIILAYDARFRHATFSRRFFLMAFQAGPNGIETIPLVDMTDPAGSDLPAEYGGTVTLNVTAGFKYGFTFGGAHFNNTTQLNGNLVLIELDGSTASLERRASQWTAEPIFEGVTGVRPAVQIDYDVLRAGGGVSPRTTDLLNFATEDGEAQFDYTLRGNHAFFAARANLAAFTTGENGSQSVIGLFDGATSGPFLVRGRTSVTTSSSNMFGIRVGGQNFDSNSRIRGTVVLSRFTATTEDECVADIDGNGIVNFFDVAAYISQFNFGCP